VVDLVGGVGRVVHGHGDIIVVIDIVAAVDGIADCDGDIIVVANNVFGVDGLRYGKGDVRPITMEDSVSGVDWTDNSKDNVLTMKDVAGNADGIGDGDTGGADVLGGGDGDI